VQAFGAKHGRVFCWRSIRAGCCIVLVTTLAGCGTAGFSIESAVPDRSIVTGSVSRQPVSPADTIKMSDEAIIRAAVSSAVVEDAADTGIGWANAETGSRGTIRNLRESRETSILCRQFTASRESYEGIHMYQGEACLGPARAWVTRSFERLQ